MDDKEILASMLAHTVLMGIFHKETFEGRRLTEAEIDTCTKTTISFHREIMDSTIVRDAVGR